MFNNFFFENCAVDYIMKNTLEPEDHKWRHNMVPTTRTLDKQGYVQLLMI
jgi:hypothetical protein